MATGGSDRLKSYKPLFKDIVVARREREEAGVQLRRRMRNEEVSTYSMANIPFFGVNAGTHSALCSALMALYALREASRDLNIHASLSHSTSLVQCSARYFQH